jgi:hypothetical protein
MILTSTVVQSDISSLIETLRKNEGTNQMIAMEYKIEIVSCIDGACNGEN